MLVLLLGISSTCYADFSEADIKNVIYDVAKYRGRTDDEIESWWETQWYEDFWEDFLSNYVNSDYDFVAAFSSNNSVNIYIQPYNVQKTITTSGNNLYYLTVYYYKAFNFSVSTGTGSRVQIYNVTNGSEQLSVRTAGNVYTYHFPIVSNSNSNNVIFSAPYSNPSWFDGEGIYTDNYLWGIADTLYDSISISGDNANSIIQGFPVYKSYFNGIYSPYGTWSVALLGGASDYVYTEYTVYRYNKFAHKWLIDFTGTNNSIWQINEENNSAFLYFKNNYLLSDSLVSLRINGNNQYSIAPYFIYCMSDYTIINNGYLDIDATIANYPTGFTYDNNTNSIQQEITDDNVQQITDNTNDIKDTLTDDSKVDTMLSDFTSGDLASNWGYEERENSYGDFLYSIAYELCDVIMDDEDVYFDYSMHGGTVHRIYASDIYLEEGLLKVFIRTFLVFCFIVMLYTYINRIIIAFNEGNLHKAFDLTENDVETIFKM